MSKRNSTEKSMVNLPLIQSIIDEEPELITGIESSENSSGNLLKNKLSLGSMIHTIYSSLAFSPLILFLSLPRAFSICGLITGLIFLIFMTGCSYASMCIILELIINYKQYNYIQLIEFTLGKRHKILIFILSIFYLCGYIFLCLQFSKLLIRFLFSYEEEDLNEKILKEKRLRQVAVVLGGCVQLGISIIRNDNIYRNLKNIQGGLFLITLIFIGAFYNNSNSSKEEKNLYFGSITTAFPVIFGITSIITFNQIVAFQHFRVLNNFSHRRGLRLSLYSSAIQLIAQNIIGILCFYCFKLKSNIFFINSLPNTLEAKILLGMILFLINFEMGIIGRQIVSLISYMLLRNNMITFIVQILVNSFVFFFLNIINHFTLFDPQITICLIGGVCVTFIAYLFPCFTYLTSFDKIYYKQKVILIGLMIGMGIIGLIQLIGIFLLLK